MGRKKGRKRGGGGESVPRRGMRRSIRHEAREESPDGPGGWDDPARSLVRPEEVQLRRLPAEEALQVLADAVDRLRAMGGRELLVVHGRGRNSPGGVPVIGPLVRNWCGDNPQAVAGWREAPPRWGGAGAIVLELRK